MSAPALSSKPQLTLCSRQLGGAKPSSFEGIGTREPYWGEKNKIPTGFALDRKPRQEVHPQERDNREIPQQLRPDPAGGEVGLSSCRWEHLIKSQWSLQPGGTERALCDIFIYLEHTGLPDPAQVRAQVRKAQSEGPQGNRTHSFTFLAAENLGAFLAPVLRISPTGKLSFPSYR